MYVFPIFLSLLYEFRTGPEEKKRVQKILNESRKQNVD